MPVPIETLLLAEEVPAAPLKTLKPTASNLKFKRFNYPTKTGWKVGGEVHGIDLNNLSEDDFLQLQHLLYSEKVLLVKGQKDLIPAKQQELGYRFDPKSPSTESHYVAPNKQTVLNRSRGDRPAFPSATLVNVNGGGHVEGPHYDIEGPFFLRHLSHIGFHKKELTAEEVEANQARFQRWHIDAPFGGRKHPPRVTFLWAHTMPPAEEKVTVHWHDGSGITMQATAGRTAFFDSHALYESLTPEQLLWVDHSDMEYAPSPYEWLGGAKAESNGLRMLNEGNEKAIEDLSEQSEGMILPIVWRNPVTNEKSVQCHAIIAYKIHYRESADGPTTIIDDLPTVRKMLDDLQRPFLRPENILIPESEVGDMLMFFNRGVRHSAVDHPRRYDRRFHQLQLLGSDVPHDPEPIAPYKVSISRI